MRIASLQLLSRSYPSRSFVAPKCLLRPNHTPRTVRPCLRGVATAIRNPRLDKISSSPSQELGDTGKRSQRERIYDGDAAQLSPLQRQDPATWVRLLQNHVPLDMDGETTSENLNELAEHVLMILHTARKPYNAGTDILTYMVDNAQQKTVLWICDMLLKNLKSKASPKLSDLPPSNILWPELPLSAMTARPFSAQLPVHMSFEPPRNWTKPVADPRHSTAMFDTRDPTMDQIWFTLGSLIVRSADLAEEEAHKFTTTVQLILGHVHNLDLIPDNVYAYQTLTHSAAISRPPIVHLLSSRILTSISDAVWRGQQEENIRKAARLGLSYKQIGRDPPGGRFRMKVSPLGAEAWLEFVLWCCVEGGFESVGQRIIGLLQSNTENPWFAATWTASNDRGLTPPYIDWERVKSRTGGTVGRLEGYSKGQPLAQIPPRTISTEVVLALVEGHINSVRLARTTHGMSLEAAQNGVVKLISFLEPHDLHPSYFDYLSARLLLSEAFDDGGRDDRQSRSKMMEKWSDRISFLKSLATVEPVPAPSISFQVGDVLLHSEFAAGFMHQVLDSFIQDGNTHDALKVFNDLQKLVDNSKLYSIGNFLRHNSPTEGDFFSPRLSSSYPDFVDTHGQLPLYKLAGLLDLATDSNLVGFGQWLLYNDGPDGPLVPSDAYGSSAMAAPLVRLATLSQDEQLVEAVPVSGQRLQKLATVNFLRASFNFKLSILDMAGAFQIMNQLTKARGGGYGLSNLARLAGTILMLESNVHPRQLRKTDVNLLHAQDLLSQILDGRHDGPGGVLQRSVRTTFRQQVTHFLTMFEVFTDSSLALLARRYRDRYRISNVIHLPPDMFNMFLEAVVEARGALFGLDMVEKFCTAESDESKTGWEVRENVVQHNGIDFVDEMEADGPLKIPSKGPSHASLTSFIPFVSHSSANDSQGDQNIDLAKPVQTPQTPSVVKETALERLNKDHASHEGAKKIFRSPFFPESDPLSPQATENSATDLESTRLHEEPVSVFNARTVRLIVRKAIAEHKGPKRTKNATDLLSSDQYDEILSWARRKFVELGFSSTTIQNEILVPIKEAKLRVRKQPDTWRRGQSGLRGVSGGVGESRIADAFKMRHNLPRSS